MSTLARSGVDLDALAAPFRSIDEGDTSGLRDIDILLDLPGVATVARMHFTTGVGYEVTTSEVAESEDYSSVITLVGSAQLIRHESWGTTENGHARMRSLFWEYSTPGPTGKPPTIKGLLALPIIGAAFECLEFLDFLSPVLDVVS